MNLKKLKIVKSDDRGIMYACDKLDYISRKKGTISADHTHEYPETLYLVKGEIKLTIDKKTKIVKAPMKIVIPKDVYHKLIAFSDIELLIDREDE